MKFDINNYKGKFAMHCKTEEEAKDFCEYMHEHGRKWCSGSSYLGSTCYHYYENEMAYAFNEGCYSDVGYYKAKGYTILEWEDFMNKTFTKADLKTGDVILRRNGDVEIVNGELKMFICKNGWTDFDGIHDDLTSSQGGNGWDIMSVRRPKTKSDCQFDAFESECGTLVYERDEVEEMTLEQVCKLLGKNIKIIK